jgi:hypothetical protein
MRGRVTVPEGIAKNKFAQQGCFRVQSAHLLAGNVPIFPDHEGRQIMRTILHWVSLVVLLLATVALKADTINFDSLSDSTIVTNQYLGVTFANTIVLTAGISLNEFEFPPHSGNNVASDNGGPMSISFATPVQSFGGYFTYAEPLTLDAFGTTNNLLLAVSSPFANNEALSGVPGSSPNEFLQVSSAAGISLVTITGDPAGGSFTTDDATYNALSSPVPEPSSWCLLLLGALPVLFSSVLRSKSYRTHFVNARGYLRSGLSLLFVVSALLSGAQSRAQLTVGSPTVAPLAIATSTPSRITVTSLISDPSVIPNSVNLLRLDPSGGAAVIVGQLHDDGTNGDLLAGDQLYTVQVELNEPTAGQIQLQVSAAFRGQLRRVTSPVITIPVTVAVNLPPDPGDAGKLTIQGIDSDGDGVRDDVQRYIALAYPNSAKTRAALTQLTMSMQGLLLDAGVPQASVNDMFAVGHAMECSIYIHGTAIADDLTKNLISQIVNTPDRAHAYFLANAQPGMSYVLTPTGQLNTRCGFDPKLLPN